ncbi:helix-turn-helix domain-containing protein [bacterium 1xD42-67]|nr:helix-turn-helix domain-containing protein [bacterium 1xD42-67]
MAVYRVERTQGYTVMSNYHLKDTALSLKAKGLLSMFLSFPDDWNYSTRGLASICKEGVEAIGNTIKELEKAGYILRRQLRGANGRITDTEYVIYERPQPPEPSAPEDAGPETPPDTGAPDTALPDTGFPDMVDPDTENRPELNIKKSKTKRSITQRSKTHSFSPPAPPKTPAAPVEGMKEILEKRAEIEEQIEYDLIADQCNREQLNEFVEIMLEVALSKSPTMKIGRDAEYPTAYVQHRFEQLTSAHIEKVLDGIRENTTRVWNTRAYLLAALFNAPSTTDNHYTMLVNHDMSTGG